jgi:hypothetical protein
MLEKHYLIEMKRYDIYFSEKWLSAKECYL